ncbi:4412_t:CDS:2, partial [Diversispora eburnea]
YWKRDPLLWGSVSDWDIYYINRVPGASKQQAHRSLSFELHTVLNALPPKSQEYYRAEDLQRSLTYVAPASVTYVTDFSVDIVLTTSCNANERLCRARQIVVLPENCKKDAVNIELWNEHSVTLGKLAVENRINKCEILTTGIRAITSAVVTQFPKKTSSKRKADEHEESDEYDEIDKHEETELEKPEEPSEPKRNKKRKNTTGSEDDQFPNNIKKWSPDHVKKFLESHMKDSDYNEIDIKKIREQDLSGRAFLRLTEEKLTRKPGLYELKPSPAEGIMELVEELNKKLGKDLIEVVTVTE